jgi:hypothetical protein
MPMTRIAAVLLSALACGVFASCSQKDTAGPSVADDQNRGTDEAASDNPFTSSPTAENANWATLTKADLTNDVNADLIPPFKGVWQPSQSDVRLAIQGARRFLEREQAKEVPADQGARHRFEKDAAKEILTKWDKYVCQAVGHTRDSKRLIHLNFFPRKALSEEKEDPTAWRRHFFIVYDGGSDYWQIDYDCNASECLYFEPNGDA